MFGNDLSRALAQLTAGNNQMSQQYAGTTAQLNQLMGLQNLFSNDMNANNAQMGMLSNLAGITKGSPETQAKLNTEAGLRGATVSNNLGSDVVKAYQDYQRGQSADAASYWNGTQSINPADTNMWNFSPEADPSGFGTSFGSGDAGGLVSNWG